MTTEMNTKMLFNTALATGLLLITMGCSSGSDSVKKISAPVPEGKNHTDKAETANCEAAGDTFGMGIVGGRALAAGNLLSRSVVLVISIHSDKKVSLCTGTLIDKNVVLTAAHCKPDGTKTFIAFTNSINCVNSAPMRVLRSVSEWKTHPDDQARKALPSNGAYDLALLKFDGAMLDGYATRLLPNQDFLVAEGDEFVVSGFGVTDYKSDDSGSLRYSTLPISKQVKKVHVNRSNEDIQIQDTVILSQPTSGVCSGDSGGGLYVKRDNALVLLGVASMVIDTEGVGEDQSRFCRGASIFTDVRTQLGWIQDTTERLTGERFSSRRVFTPKLPLIN